MKGIMFTEDMFGSVIKEDKTQTRRIVKIEPEFELINKAANQWTSFDSPEHDGEIHYRYPRYFPGEIVYLKEPYFLVSGIMMGGGGSAIFYKYLDTDEFDKRKFKNKMFMPEKYARYFILIENVRIERLNEISGPDAVAEGFGQQYAGYELLHYGGYKKARLEFFDKWKKINGPIPEIKPYVWAYDFKLTEKPTS